MFTMSLRTSTRLVITNTTIAPKNHFNDDDVGCLAKNEWKYGI